MPKKGSETEQIIHELREAEVEPAAAEGRGVRRVSPGGGVVE